METVDLSQPKTPKNKKPLLITAAVSIFLALIAAIAVYLWQQGLVAGLSQDKKDLNSKVDSLTSQLDKLNKVEKKNADLAAKVAFLDKALREATASANQEIGSLTITINSVKEWDDPMNLADDDTLEIIMSLDIKNNTDQPLYYSKFAMKLKDAQNHTYGNPYDPPTTVCTEGGAADCTTKPTGFTRIPDQGVQPGETISGEIAFGSLPKSTKNYTFFYEEQTFPITVK
ncbi:MAG: DUF4352 domain-containing protein [bacterium]|nr:DUF4352 domain-containing protein [bacterium]